MFFVSGITGQVGGAAVRRLLEAGKTVRSLSRNPGKAGEWSRRGVEVRGGDFREADDIGSALEGVEGAFLMLPPFNDPEPGFPEAKAMIASFREALRRSPPPRLVLLSSIGSQQDHGLGMITATQMLESGLADLPIPTAFVRPGSFLENYTHGLDTAAESGVFHSFWAPTDRGFPMVATADIGAEVARLLIEGWDGLRKIVELGSRTSPDDLADAMTEVLGRPVEARAVPREKWSETLKAQGFPPRAVTLYEEMVDSCNSGWIDFGVPGTESVPATMTPAEVFKRARDD